jgi:hypothetical protein
MSAQELSAQIDRANRRMFAQLAEEMYADERVVRYSASHTAEAAWALNGFILAA